MKHKHHRCKHKIGNAWSRYLKLLQLSACIQRLGVRVTPHPTPPSGQIIPFLKVFETFTRTSMQSSVENECSCLCTTHISNVSIIICIRVWKYTYLLEWSLSPACFRLTYCVEKYDNWQLMGKEMYLTCNFVLSPMNNFCCQIAPLRFQNNMCRIINDDPWHSFLDVLQHIIKLTIMIYFGLWLVGSLWPLHDGVMAFKNIPHYWHFSLLRHRLCCISCT